MRLGALSQFMVDLPAPVNQVQRHQPEPGDAKGEESSQEPTGLSKTSRANTCATQRCFLLIGTFGVLLGAAIGVGFLVKDLLKPLPLQDTEAGLARCRDGTEEGQEDRGTPTGRASGQKVSFRINRGNFLLEVSLEGQPRWLLVCHESWDPSLGTGICRQLGHIRLTHHKGVNLTDVKVNGTQEFAHVVPDHNGQAEGIWQTRHQCPSGRIVALKCSECGTHPKAPGMMEGNNEPARRWPWEVSLSLSARPVCAGSVLSHEWIVTAAHCVHMLLPHSNWGVVAGQETHPGVGERAGAAVEKTLPHPSYNSRSHAYDIAVLKLKEPLNLSDSVQAVCLPRYYPEIPRGNTCWISAQAHVAKMPVTLIDTKACNSSCGYRGTLTPEMLCTSYLDGSTGACQGNSGGPLVCQHEQTWHLMGIGSWGARCAESEQAGVYTKVAALLDWIHHVIESD